MIGKFIDAAWTHLAAEVSVIAGAPLASLLVVGMAFIVCFYFVKWFHGEKVETLEQRLKLATEQVADYKDKLKGASPENAAKEMAELRAQISRLEPRKLSDEQRRIITAKMESIRQKESVYIHVMHDGTSSDSNGYAVSFYSVFKEFSLWTVRQSTVIGIGGQVSRHGVSIFVENIAAPPTGARLISEALKGCGIEHDMYTRQANSIQSRWEFELLITTRQT